MLHALVDPPRPPEDGEKTPLYARLCVMARRVCSRISADQSECFGARNFHSWVRAEAINTPQRPRVHVPRRHEPRWRLRLWREQCKALSLDTSLGELAPIPERL